MKQSFIKIRTQFEGFHHYPGAGKIDNRLRFLETLHRHIFYVEVTMSVNHNDREIEFFLAKWALEEFLHNTFQSYKSCEMIADDILENHLFPTYGNKRHYNISVSEDNESDGIVTWTGETN